MKQIRSTYVRSTVQYGTSSYVVQHYVHLCDPKLEASSRTYVYESIVRRNNTLGMMVPCSSNGDLSADDKKNASNKSDDLVSSARYPIPQHLGELLQKSSSLDPTTNAENAVELESIEKALELLMCNSFVAMDSMYFSW